jgi:hypothetical protein
MPKTNAELAKELIMLASDESSGCSPDDRTTLHEAAARLVRQAVENVTESRLERRLRYASERVIRVVVEKDREYGSSWKQAPYAPFENIRRKFDRLKFQVAKVPNYDLLAMLRANRDSEDTLGDLVGYGLLALQEAGLDVPVRGPLAHTEEHDAASLSRVESDDPHDIGPFDHLDGEP